MLYNCLKNKRSYVRGTLRQTIVLLTTDNELIDVLTYFFPQQDIQVVGSKTIQQAIDLIKEGRSSVLLCDTSSMLANGPEILGSIEKEIAGDLMIILLNRDHLTSMQYSALHRISPHIHPLILWPTDFTRSIRELIQQQGSG